MIAVCRRMNDLGINQGTSGNLSVRVDGGFLVTPSGMAYGDLAPDDIVHVGPDTGFTGHRRPSSEWRFHLDILAARPDAGAVLHTHSAHATALSCLRRGIPAFHYMVAAAGGRDIRCGGYATFGTQALSDRAVAALHGRRACLLANHGLIALGATAEKALDLAVEVETLAQQYLLALGAGEPVLLDDAEMDRVLELFKTYGSQDPAAGRRWLKRPRQPQVSLPAAKKIKT
ncbi:MAG: class II aldolase/adducin family protein [Hyphomicrobiales bacterium]|nr:class II aldolase/adducin family protein [Hyphomicrobiales bacterium]MCP5371648.1 class II aldolase/adducin family protein [Hyphomicrobiales bacterium]